MSTPDVESPAPAEARAAVTSYLAGTRAALADLPAAEVEEIMDDVGPHVAEVADELGDEDLDRRLADRLGSPEEYAAELRAAAGYPPRTAQPQARAASFGVVRLALLALAAAIVIAFYVGLVGDSLRGGYKTGWLLVLAGGFALGSLLVLLRRPGGVSEIAELPELARPLEAARFGGTVGTYARLLQPSWWLARAGIAAVMVVFVFDTRRDAGLLLAVFAAFAVGSIWVGRRSQADRRWLWAVLPLNALAIGLSLFLLDRPPLYPVAYADQSSPGSQWSPPHYDNIFVVDRDGKPLTEVYLYDQDGQPITPYYSAESCTPKPPNQYPKPEVQFRPDGACIEVPARLPGVGPFPTATATSSPPPTTVTATPTG